MPGMPEGLEIRDRAYRLGARRWNADGEIQGLLAEARPNGTAPYSAEQRDALLGRRFDRAALAQAPLSYERLDQLTMEILLGVR